MTVGWDEINAYVDQELDAGTVARVAAAIARDPELAGRVATVARLKAVTRGLSPQRQAPPFPENLAAPDRRRWTAWKPLAAAACLALLLLAAGSVSRLGQPALVDPIAAAVSNERVWLSGRTVEGAGLGIAGAAGQDGRLPDLSAADLHLGYLAVGAGGTDGGVFAGYVGPNGCRLGLWSGAGDGSDYPPTPRDLGAVRIRAWSDGHRTFALMSETMGAERLDHLAALVAALASDPSRRTPASEERHRSALSLAARARTPCLG